MKQVFMKKTMAFLLSSALVVTSVLVPATTSKAAVKPTSMTLNQGSKTTMYVGGSTTIKVKSVKPSKASKAVTFKSSNSKIVKVTSKGKVTALSAGKATVTVKSKANTKLSKKVKVTVKDLVKKTTDEQIVIPLTKKNYKLSLNTSASNLTFKSSKKTVASVSSKGVITPKKAGTAKITVTGKKGAVKGAKQVITVYVAKKAVKSVKLNATKKTINVGKSFTLKATVNPTGASNKVTFTSSNPKVVTVSNKGVVKGIKAGTAKITVTTLDGNKKASCTVTVVSPKPTATKAPTKAPTKVPTKAPTKVPTTKPTATVEPTATVTPTAEPTAEPTATVAPTAEPTATVAPTAEPTATVAPTAEPTAEPTATVTPTAEPTAEPTATVAPTAEPTAEPTATVAPTAEPTAEPTATVTPTAEPTATVAPTAEPTPAGVYTYTFDKSATSYEITKKGADYTIAIAREDLVKDINTVKEKLQAPITSEVIKNQWPKFTKENMVENSEILQANKSLLKNFDIAPADPGLVNKMVTITKDGKTSWAIIRPNEAFTEFDVETYKDGNRKNVSVKAEGLAECKADENGIVTLPVTVSGLKTGDIKLKVEYPTDLSYVKLYKTVGSKDKMVMWYKETTKDYTLYIDETYADEFCDAMGVGNVFETISVKNIYAD